MKKLCLMFLASLFVITACSSASPRPLLLDPVTARTGSVRVSYGNVEVKTIHPGLVRVQSEAVRLETGSGILGAIYAWPGDEVTAGQLLARLDIENLRERYDDQLLRIANMRRLHSFVNEENALEISALELSYANTVWDAAENFDTDAIERAERIRENIEWANLTMQQTIATQNASLAREERRITELRDALADANIYAPISGTISYIAIGPGEWANTFAPIMYIICHNADFFIEYVGQTLNLLRTRAVVREQGQIGTTFFDLAFIPPTAEEQAYYTRRGIAPPIRFEVTCDNFEWPPVSTAVSLHFYSRFYENVLRVPRNVLFTDSALNQFVYRIEDGNQVQVFVTTGTITETYVAILSGLQEGDEIFVRP